MTLYVMDHPKEGKIWTVSEDKAISWARELGISVEAFEVDRHPLLGQPLDLPPAVRQAFAI